MGFTLEQFLAESERIAPNAMDNSFQEEVLAYPFILMDGITEIERKYLENLEGFLEQAQTRSDDVQLVVKLGNESILLGYVPMGLKTFIHLNTLKERVLTIVPNEDTIIPVDDTVFMQFICQDTR